MLRVPESRDPQVSHQALFEDYLSGHVTLTPEPAPCQDEDVLKRGAQVLLGHPLPEGSATLTRLCQHLLESGFPTNLSRLVRATELLETLCLNLYLQPWRKEFRKLKTFTGAFVYCLLPALGTSTLQFTLASIGYLPIEPGLLPREYRLCEDATPERVLRVAFQLLLIRALCLHLLQLQQHNSSSAQLCVERLRLKLPTAELSQHRTTISTEERESNQVRRDETDLQDKLNSALHLQATDPKTSSLSEDQSINHLHMTYPDLVLRGRPLRQEDDDPGLSQQTALGPYRRHAQRSELHRPTNQRAKSSVKTRA
ncbi:hypothetical protein WMY93_018233 [Mugilogobius chulae]|uniref:Spermatogenesis-associated protein 2 PUB-like domain-containing protein n=1 Tax=Mugilogobius chulae TaxID=88201 RepID=A0AAW0NVI5_9GOBI